MHAVRRQLLFALYIKVIVSHTYIWVGIKRSAVFLPRLNVVPGPVASRSRLSKVPTNYLLPSRSNEPHVHRHAVIRLCEHNGRKQALCAANCARHVSACTSRSVESSSSTRDSFYCTPSAVRRQSVDRGKF